MKNDVSYVWLLGVLTISTSLHAADKPPIKLELLEVNKVWDRGKHNAFTDLIRFHGRWYLTFREAPEHGVPDVGQPGGRIRVLRSDDGAQWASAALLDEGRGQDLRDPKLSVTPAGKLMVLCAAAPNAVPTDRQPLVYLSDDGTDWSGAHKVGEHNYWLWRVTWHKGMARGVGYFRTGHRHARLYESGDGLHYKVLVSRLHEEGFPSEASLLFLRDDRALCLLRRGEPGKSSALLGSASPPYTNWSWKDLGLRVGGPALLEIPDRHIIAGTRLYDGHVRMSLCYVDPDAGTLTELLELPSGGDTSYPGFVWHDDQLWVSYYSSHEGKTSIYLAKVLVTNAR